MSTTKFNCPICANELERLKNRHVEYMLCHHCCLWSNLIDGRYIKHRQITRWGFVKIKTGIKDYGDARQMIDTMCEIITIINETKKIWNTEYYRECYLQFANGDLPAFAFYDMLGDWGLLRQQKAFEEVRDELNVENWRVYSFSVEYSEYCKRTI